MPYFRSVEAWNLVNSFRSLYGVREKISSIYWNDLPDDYYIKSLEKINHVTLSDVERALHKYFRKDQIHVVVVGDPSPTQRNTKRLLSP
jgi:predicted Zn-dependent peptidase